MAALLFLGAPAEAQTPPGSDTNAIANDRTGRYAWIDSVGFDSSKWYAAKTCHGRTNRWVFANIGQALFQFPREKVDTIFAPALARIEISPGVDREFYAADAGCRENPIKAISATLSLPAPLISIYLSDGRPPPAEIDSYADTYDCHKSAEYNNCLVGVGHSEAWIATDPAAKSQSGAPLGYDCNIAIFFGESNACHLQDHFRGTKIILAFERKSRFEDMPIADLRRLYDLGYAAIDRFRIEN